VGAGACAKGTAAVRGTGYPGGGGEGRGEVDGTMNVHAAVDRSIGIVVNVHAAREIDASVRRTAYADLEVG
jgi:hypothetical protein